MAIITSIYFLLVGLVLGSFYHLLGWRLPRGEFFTYKRSFCTHCHYQLKAIDLVPILSYLLTKGKCRQCKHSISLIYPISEGITATIFVLAYWQWGLSGELVFNLILFSFLICAAISDFHYMVIPNRYYLIFGLPLFGSWAYCLFYHEISLPLYLYDLIASVSLCLTIFILLTFILPDKIGLGDIKLFLFLSLFFKPLAWVWIVFIASTSATLYLLFFQRKDLKRTAPFVPFIALATFVLSFMGKGL